MPQTTEIITIGFNFFRFVSPTLILGWRRSWVKEEKPKNESSHLGVTSTRQLPEQKHNQGLGVTNLLLLVKLLGKSLSYFDPPV